MYIDWSLGYLEALSVVVKIGSQKEGIQLYLQPTRLGNKRHQHIHVTDNNSDAASAAAQAAAPFFCLHACAGPVPDPPRTPLITTIIPKASNAMLSRGLLVMGGMAMAAGRGMAAAGSSCQSRGRLGDGVD